MSLIGDPFLQHDLSQIKLHWSLNPLMFDLKTYNQKYDLFA